MHRTRGLTGVALTITLLAVLVLAASAGAQEAQDAEVIQLGPSRDSAVSGTATLEDVEGGVEVTLYMRNLPKPGAKYINHIHVGGTCADDRAGKTAPPKFPLKPLVAKQDGTGSATTKIEGISVATLFGEDEERNIMLHAAASEGEGIPPTISCADLTSSAQQTTEVQLTPSRDSGVSGTATLEDVEGGVELTLYMQGLEKAGTEYISHIHAGGTCADDRAGRPAPATNELKPLVAEEGGAGFMTTRIDNVSVATLFGEYKHRYINFHPKAKDGEGIPPGITCGDLTPLPATGGTRPLEVGLLVAAVLALSPAMALLALLRRVA